ncbi:MAG TPA: hypothetical protein VNJ46_05595, partial [Gaiellaceae bacterium]|nr:hypothetical protein [Gaiellaceae bacterium]
RVASLERQLGRLRTENRRLRARAASLSPEGIARRLERTKAALDRYRSVDRARADGYVQASPCEAVAPAPGEATSRAGGMGIHFVSAQALGDGRLDPARPEVLVYAPGLSALELVAAEYFQPDADQNVATDDDRPRLFGRDFDGPMLGHAPGMPVHYDLHVWLWKHNPSGMFAPWNAAVSC